MWPEGEPGWHGAWPQGEPMPDWMSQYADHGAWPEGEPVWDVMSEYSQHQHNWPEGEPIPDWMLHDWMSQYGEHNATNTTTGMWPEAEPTVGGEPIPRTPCVCDDVGLCSTFDDGAGGEDAYCAAGTGWAGEDSVCWAYRTDPGFLAMEGCMYTEPWPEAEPAWGACLVEWDNLHFCESGMLGCASHSECSDDTYCDFGSVCYTCDYACDNACDAFDDVTTVEERPSCAICV